MHNQPVVIPSSQPPFCYLQHYTLVVLSVILCWQFRAPSTIRLCALFFSLFLSLLGSSELAAASAADATSASGVTVQKAGL